MNKLKIHEIFDKIKRFEEYNQFLKDNPTYFLVHLFKKIDDKEWQIGYYSKETKRMITLFLNSKLKISEPNEILSKPNTEIYELKLDRIKLDYDKAIEIFNEEYNKNLNKPSAFMYFILQNLKEYDVLYNITALSKEFKIINIKISAIDGRILNKEIYNTTEFGKFIK